MTDRAKTWAGRRAGSLCAPRPSSARLVGLIAGLLLLASGTVGRLETATAQVTGEIVGPGATSYPIAVPPLREVGGPQDDAVVRFADILGRDLALSGYFRVLDRAAYIEDPQAAGTTEDEIEFHNWSVIGALALVKGTLERTAEGLVIEVRLFDVAGRRPLTAKRYRAPPRELPRAAHRFADEILRTLTGIVGPFDSQIAFISTREGHTKELYAITFDSDVPTRLTAERSIVVAPAWHPAGTRLLFTSYRTWRPGLYELDLASRQVRPLATTGALSAGGAWSPDGTLVATTVELGGNPEIVLLRPDGSLARRLTTNPAIDVSPAWSPDGRQIAFCSDRAGGPQIFIAGADGSGVRRVTYGGDYNTAPAWSPRRDEIAYTGRVGGRFQIFIVDARGGRGEMITNDPGDNEDPSWSPDGRYLVFSSTRMGATHLFMVDRRGRVRKQLTHGETNDTSPTWSARRD